VKEELAGGKGDSFFVSSISSGLCYAACMCVGGCELQDVIYPSFVKIVEVGPRDGLQNEKVHDFCLSFQILSTQCLLVVHYKIFKHK